MYAQVDNLTAEKVKISEALCDVMNSNEKHQVINATLQAQIEQLEAAVTEKSVALASASVVANSGSTPTLTAANIATLNIWDSMPPSTGNHI